MKAKVLVAMPTDYYYHYPFMTSYVKAIQLHESEGDIDIRLSCYQNIVASRNKSCNDMLTEGHTHIFFMDSDMKFPPYTLSRLLYNDKDIIGGLYMRKAGGFYPNVFKIDHDGEMKTFLPDFNMLVKCDAIGTGSLLIKRNVIESIDPLWFEYKPYPKEEERFKTQSEDVVFCEKVRKAGFDIYCDSSVKCGHIGHMIVWPDSTQKVRVEPL